MIGALRFRRLLTRWLCALVIVALCAGCERQPGKESGSVASEEAAAPEPAVSPTTSGAAPAADVDCFVIVDAEPDLGAPPLKVVFETEVDCTSEPARYEWDFGDGTKGGNEPAPTHLYDKEGDFLAIVTVTAPDGAVGTDEIDITVDELLGD